MEKYQVAGLILIIPLFLLIIGCEYDVAQPGWYDDYTRPPEPEISGVEPADSATAGVNLIEIYGSNFATPPIANKVYFNNVRSEVVDGSNDYLVVRRPNLASDSVVVKVASDSADVVISYDQLYKVSKVWQKYGGFVENVELAALTVDANGNLYVVQRSPATVYKVDSTGNRANLGDATRVVASDVRVAPDGNLVIVKEYRRTYRYYIATQEEVEWLDSGSSKKTPKSGDFDRFGNFYFGGIGTDLRVVADVADSTGVPLGLYPDDEIQYVRVFNDYLYIMIGSPPTGIWRHSVSSDGTLGAKELVLDLANVGEYAEAIPRAFTMSSTGDLYIGLEYEQSIMVWNSADNSVDLLYKDIVPSYAVHLEWGPDRYLYMLIGGEEWTVIQIDMGSLRGASK
jgi:hypothetical protein